MQRLVSASNLESLSQEDRRSLYRSLVRAATFDPTGSEVFIKHMAPPPTIGNNLQKISSWHNITKSLANEVARKGKIAIWAYYEHTVSENAARKLGQYFTPPQIASFALSGLTRNPETILDPMAGHGSFLIEANKGFPSAKIVGVDIDPLPLSAARLMLDEKVALIEDDIFRWALSRVENDTSFSFSAIVGNPAFVSYQNLENLRSLGGTETGHTEGYRSYLVGTLKKISRLKGLDGELRNLFHDWSGFNDLATYCLVLSWLLTAENGEIAFVMSNHWMEREYGRRLREFLAAHGTIRVVLTHRGGKWFPRAQIPTSIIVYSKGDISKRQRETGVPYIEIHGPFVNNLTEYSKNQTGGDFWHWIDTCEKEGEYGQIRVTFRDWLLKHGLFRMDSNTMESDHRLHLPDHLKQIEFVSIRDLGWEVHQGLRTGCNEVFYVRASSSTGDYLGRITSSGKRSEVSLQVPNIYLLPALQKLRRNSSLVFSTREIDTYLLNFSGAALEEDVESLKEYPASWLELWNVDAIRLIPEAVASYLRNRAVMPYEGKGTTRKRVTELAAVRTNIYKPSRGSSDTAPRPPRFWYQISLQRRHFGEIAIPRVSSGPVRAILIPRPGEIVVDANFLTYVPLTRSLSAESLWIWLNSNSFRGICESNAVPLGGGALKLEAELLSRIPVPRIVKEMDEPAISSFAKSMEQDEIGDDSLLKIGMEVDSLLFGESVANRNMDYLNRVIPHRRRPG